MRSIEELRVAATRYHKHMGIALVVCLGIVALGCSFINVAGRGSRPPTGFLGQATEDISNP